MHGQLAPMSMREVLGRMGEWCQLSGHWLVEHCARHLPGQWWSHKVYLDVVDGAALCEGLRMYGVQYGHYPRLLGPLDVTNRSKINVSVS